jgi:hypothetical protein
MTRQERFVYNVELYFKPLAWMVHPKKHRIGFYFMWFIVVLGIVLSWSTQK